MNIIMTPSPNIYAISSMLLIKLLKTHIMILMTLSLDTFKSSRVPILLHFPSLPMSVDGVPSR